MTIEISVSQSIKKSDSYLENHGCDFLINDLKKCGIEGKFVPNKSIINNNIEIGCTITLDKKYSDKKNLDKIWKIIKDSSKNDYFTKPYDCAYININSEFKGCIINYLNMDSCPFSKYNL